MANQAAHFRFKSWLTEQASDYGKALGGMALQLREAAVTMLVLVKTLL